MVAYMTHYSFYPNIKISSTPYICLDTQKMPAGFGLYPILRHKLFQLTVHYTACEHIQMGLFLTTETRIWTQNLSDIANDRLSDGWVWWPPDLIVGCTQTMLLYMCKLISATEDDPSCGRRLTECHRSCCKYFMFLHALKACDVPLWFCYRLQ